MALDQKETSRIWWGGTLKGAVKGLAIGLVMGALSALALQFVILPLIVPGAASAFAGFLTLETAKVTGIVAAGGMVPAASFSVVPLAIFSGISGMIANLFGSGNRAVGAYKEEHIHAMQERKLASIENAEAVAHSFVKTHGHAQETDQPRTTISAAEAQIARLQNAPSSKSLH